MGKSDERIVLLLDPQRVLSFEETKQLQETNAKGELKETSENLKKMLLYYKTANQCATGGDDRYFLVSPVAQALILPCF